MPLLVGQQIRAGGQGPASRIQRTSGYRITVLQAAPDADATFAAGITVDGIGFDGDYVPLVDDGAEHLVEVRIVPQARP